MNSTHHYLWIGFAFCVLCAVTYLVTLNRPDSYKGNAIHAEQHRQDWPLSIHIGEGGCASLRPDGLPVTVKDKKK